MVEEVKKSNWSHVVLRKDVYSYYHYFLNQSSIQIEENEWILLEQDNEVDEVLLFPAIGLDS